MNFTPFWSVDQHSDLLYVHPNFYTSHPKLLIMCDSHPCSFWTVALPVMAVLIPVFMLGEIRKGVRNLKRRYDTQQTIRHHHRQ